MKGPPARSSRFFFLAAGLLAATAGLVVLYFFDPAASGFYPVCVLHQITGLQCPGCGGLRAAHQLLHGDLDAAWRLNPLVFVLPPAVLWLGLREWARAGAGRTGRGPAVPAGFWLGGGGGTDCVRRAAQSAVARVMKFSLTLGSRRALARAEAWACLSANLALPGAGSLAAGLKIGYLQMALALIGLAVSVAAGIPMIQWALANWGRIMQPSPADDPLASLMDLWHHARWPTLGIVIFFAAFLWGAATGLSLLANAPKDAVPPRIG